MEQPLSKTCSECNVEKPLDAFCKDKNGKFGRAYQCRECRNKRHSEWRKNNPDRIKELNEKHRETRRNYYQRPDVKLRNRMRYIEKTFGIKYSLYEELNEKQGGLCAICGREETSAANTYLAVDHCHATGIIRGLLCSACNIGIGLFREQIEILEKAKQYLIEQGKTNNVPN